MDCSVVKTAIPGIYTVSTTDFFYPLVDEPYLQGRIAACNVVRGRARTGLQTQESLHTASKWRNPYIRPLLLAHSHHLQMQESLHTASHLPGQELLRPPCETFILMHPGV